MPSYDHANGELPQIQSQLPQELSSLSEAWLTESWLLQAGVVPKTAVNTLVMYGYAQPGVEHVELIIDQDETHNGARPKIKYHIRLNPSAKLKLEMYEKTETIKSPLLRKVSQLAVLKTGVPLGILEAIKEHARDYLPKNFEVEAEFVDRE